MMTKDKSIRNGGVVPASAKTQGNMSATRVAEFFLRWVVATVVVDVDVETQCIASLPETIWNNSQSFFSYSSTPTELLESIVIDPELRYACKGLFTLYAYGVPVRRLFADDVFAANIRKFRRNDMSVADNRKQSENSVRNDMLKKKKR
jgi:hypothetical protein